eukprot:403362584
MISINPDGTSSPQVGLILSFYNQVNIYCIKRIQNQRSVTSETLIELVQAFIVQDISEDIQACEFNCHTNELYFAGDLGVIYASSIDEAHAPYRKMFGHFKTITQLKVCPSNSQLLLSCSNDFSVRLWDVKKQLQIMLFLDIEDQVSELLNIDWQLDGSTFLTFGINQHLRVWEIHSKAKTHIDKILQDDSIKKTQDVVLVENFPKHCYFQIIEYCDYAQFFGDELIILKSPVNGILFIKPLNKDEFMPIKTVSFQQFLLDSVSNIAFVGRYVLSGDSQGRVFMHNLSYKEDFTDGQGTQKLGNAFDQEQLAVNFISALQWQNENVVCAASKFSNIVSVTFTQF